MWPYTDVEVTNAVCETKYICLVVVDLEAPSKTAGTHYKLSTYDSLHLRAKMAYTVDLTRPSLEEHYTRGQLSALAFKATSSQNSKIQKVKMACRCDVSSCGRKRVKITRPATTTPSLLSDCCQQWKPAFEDPTSTQLLLDKVNDQQLLCLPQTSAVQAHYIELQSSYLRPPLAGSLWPPPS